MATKIFKIPPPRILVAPLDWGLGHACRCIPILRALIRWGAVPIIAGSGRSGLLLQKEFPTLLYLDLPWPDIRYQKNGKFEWAILRQMPQIIRAIKSEHRLLEEVIERYAIDAVISDNRYGLWSTRVPSVIISHQLSFILPGWMAALEKILEKCAYHYIRKFNALWIPDMADQNNLSGGLSRAGWVYKLPQVKHIGILSRLDKISLPRQYDIAILLSGQEPQRSVLEEILIPQLKSLGKKTILVRGITEGSRQHRYAEGIEIVDYATSEEINKIMASSELIICRSGYTSLMDICKMGNLALLIPTPGQTEQEYLAQKLKEEGRFYMITQSEICLQKDYPLSLSYAGMSTEKWDPTILESVLNEFLTSL